VVLGWEVEDKDEVGMCGCFRFQGVRGWESSDVTSCSFMCVGRFRVIDEVHL
jgi:hypothetical protein